MYSDGNWEKRRDPVDLKFCDATTYKSDFKDQSVNVGRVSRGRVRSVDTRRCLVPDLQKIKDKRTMKRICSRGHRGLYNGEGAIYDLVRRGTVDIEGKFEKKIKTNYYKKMSPTPKFPLILPMWGCSYND